MTDLYSFFLLHKWTKLNQNSKYLLLLNELISFTASFNGLALHHGVTETNTVRMYDSTRWMWVYAAVSRKLSVYALWFYWTAHNRNNHNNTQYERLWYHSVLSIHLMNIHISFVFCLLHSYQKNISQSMQWKKMWFCFAIVVIITSSIELNERKFQISEKTQFDNNNNLWCIWNQERLASCCFCDACYLFFDGCFVLMRRNTILKSTGCIQNITFTLKSERHTQMIHTP